MTSLENLIITYLKIKNYKKKEGACEAQGLALYLLS